MNDSNLELAKLDHAYATPDPYPWVLTFDFEGGKVKTIVIARTSVGALTFAPLGATNIKVRLKGRRRNGN
jgi:hypothetical protein